MWAIDAATVAALSAEERVTGFRFEVLSEQGDLLDTLAPATDGKDGVIGGQVTCSTDAIRWTGSITVTGDLVPLRVGDLLHPYSYNRVKPYVRVRLADGTWGEVPLAPMYVDSAPSLSDSGLTPAVEATLGLSDAVSLIKRAGWRTVLDLSGDTAHHAIERIVNTVAPWVSVIVTEPATSHTLPSEYEVGEPGGDPWMDVATLCEAAGLIAYVDRDGRMRVEEQPTTTAVRWFFVEGAADCLMVDVTADIDLGEIENVVAVQSDSEDVDPPVVGWWEDDDPMSPLYAGDGHVLFNGPRSNPAVTTLAQAEAVATRVGAMMRAVTQTVTIGTVPVPHLDPWDLVGVTRARVGVEGTSQVKSWTIDLDPTQLMAITASGRVAL